MEPGVKLTKPGKVIAIVIAIICVGLALAILFSLAIRLLILIWS